jgi:hypothetical protein
MASKRATYKEVSRVDWQRSVEVQEGHQGTPFIGMDGVYAGCLQRIADAQEAMSHNYVNLLRDVENFRKWYYDECAETSKLRAEISNLKRLKNRYKNQLLKLKQDANGEGTTGTDEASH